MESDKHNIVSFKNTLDRLKASSYDSNSQYIIIRDALLIFLSAEAGNSILKGGNKNYIYAINKLYELIKLHVS